MFWTAIYFLILLGVGCWYLFEWYFPTKKLKAFYSSPSDAIIDQCLPDVRDEVMITVIKLELIELLISQLFIVYCPSNLMKKIKKYLFLTERNILGNFGTRYDIPRLSNSFEL